MEHATLSLSPRWPLKRLGWDGPAFLDEDSLSGRLFLFLEEVEEELSTGVALFSTAGVLKALFLKSSRSLSRAGSILPRYTWLVKN